MNVKFKYYRYHDHPDLTQNSKRAIDLFKSEIEFANEDRIEIFPDIGGIAVYETELDQPIKTRESNNYHLTLEKPINEEYLAGSRFLERYSYFQLQVNNYNGGSTNISISFDLERGEKFKESVIKNKGWDNYLRYVSYIVYGIKQKCIELEIADLQFQIIDLEYNLYTSSLTSQYAVKVFFDKHILPKLINKASI